MDRGSILRLHAGFWTLVAALATVSAAGGDTRTNVQYESVPNHPGLLAGVAESNKQPALSYALESPRGRDRLPPGEPPERHFKSCLIAKTADDLFDEARSRAVSPDQRRRACLQFLIYWGDYLSAHKGRHIEDERTEADRGQRFLEFAFELLVGELKDAGIAQLPVQQQMDLRVTGRADPGGPSPELEAPLRYHLWVWNALPDDPQTYQEFIQKLSTGEELKHLYKAGAGLLTRETAIVGLEFFEKALRFHQKPVPDPKGCCKVPERIMATLEGAMRCYAPGYTAYPGEIGYRPVVALPRTDVIDAAVLLDRVAALKLMPESELRSRSEKLKAESTRLEISLLRERVARAQAQGDVREVIDQQVKMAQHYRDLGDWDNAAALLAEVTAHCREMGSAREWAERSVDLASFKLAKQEFQAALAQIVEVRPVLISGYLFDALERALQYEAAAREKLGMPPPDANVLRQIADSAESFPNLRKEPDRQKRIRLLRAYLEQPGAPPYLRTLAQLELFRTLAEVREYDAAEELAMAVRPELRKWEGVPGEETLLGELLDVQANRGNFGGFYATLREYEALGQRLWGGNWVGANGRTIAEFLFRLQDYDKAQELLQRHMESDRLAELSDDSVICLPRSSAITQNASPGVHDADLLLEARIQFELGRREEAARIIQQLASGIGELSKGDQSPKRALLLDLAEIDTALGRPKDAAEKLTRLLTSMQPSEDPNLWAKASIQAGKLRLTLGQPAAEIAADFERVIPNLTDFPELNAVNAVEMDIWLADYYTGTGESSEAVKRLNRGLALSEKLGALDQQIVIERKIGEIAAKSGDLAGAAVHFRRSIERLRGVSSSIPYDAAKVGYRAERTKAIPLLAETLYQMNARSGEKAQREELLRTIEEGKSRALIEILSGSTATQPEPLSLERVRNALGQNGALLEYYVPGEGSDKVFRILLDRASLEVEQLAMTADELSTGIQVLLDQVREPEWLDEPGFKTRAMAMAAKLLPRGWSSDQSIPYQRLYIVPSGILYLFPFSLLVDANGHWFGESGKLEFSYLPSASMLERSGPASPETPRSLALVNPAGDRDLHDGLSQSGDLQESLTKAFRRWSGGPLRWEETVTPTAFLDSAGKLDNVLVYSHALFDPNQPTRSYISLAEENGHSSKVTAADLLHSHVGHGLWVLAGCSTGAGKVRSGDEVLGLPRALLEAGASEVVISLWDIDSQGTLQMMTQFYERLASGDSPAVALREAAGSLRRLGRSPYEWAPFILVGHNEFTR